MTWTYPDRNLRFSYAEFNMRVDMMAKGLMSIGMQPGQKLGIWANNVPDWLTFMFASKQEVWSWTYPEIPKHLIFDRR